MTKTATLTTEEALSYSMGANGYKNVAEGATVTGNFVAIIPSGSCIFSATMNNGDDIVDFTLATAIPLFATSVTVSSGKAILALQERS